MPIRNEFLETVVGSPPDGWSLGHVTLSLKNPEERVPVEAWRRGAFAVHEKINLRRAVLSHAPSGLRIWTFETMDQAADAAERLEPLADWMAFTEAVPHGSALYPKVRAILDSLSTNAE